MLGGSANGRRRDAGLHGDATSVRAQLRRVIAYGRGLDVMFAPIVLHPVPVAAPDSGLAAGAADRVLRAFGEQIVQHFD